MKSTTPQLPNAVASIEEVEALTDFFPKQELERIAKVFTEDDYIASVSQNNGQQVWVKYDSDADCAVFFKQ